MKRIFGALAGILGLVGLVAVMRYHAKPTQVATTTTATKSSTAPSPIASATPTAAAPAATPSAKQITPTPKLAQSVQAHGSTVASTPASAPAPTPTPAGQYRNGSYTGQAFNNVYGTVQISVVISDGQITGINFLQMPSGGESSTVTAQAEPQLRQETISAQSASIDTVSGATQTSGSYKSSLASALSQGG